MTDATPPTTPAAPEPAKPAKPAAAAAATVPAGELGGGANTPLDMLRDHQSTMVVALAIVVALLAVVLIKQKQRGDLDSRAWEALGALREKEAAGTEGYSQLATDYKGTSADPFIRIAWASRLYETNRQENVTLAKEFLEQVVRENASNPFIKANVPGQLARIEAELKDPKAHWSTAAATPPPPATPPPGAPQ